MEEFYWKLSAEVEEEGGTIVCTEEGAGTQTPLSLQSLEQLLSILRGACGSHLSVPGSSALSQSRGKSYCCSNWTQGKNHV